MKYLPGLKPAYFTLSTQKELINRTLSKRWIWITGHLPTATEILKQYPRFINTLVLVCCCFSVLHHDRNCGCLKKRFGVVWPILYQFNFSPPVVLILEEREL